MAKFTKFGIWDLEVKQMIDDLAQQTKLSAAILTDWIYETGVVTFIKAQGMKFYCDSTDYLRVNSCRPKVSLENIIDHKKAGFEALKIQMLEQLKMDEADQQALLVIYAAFVKNAIESHQDFYQLQARITTEYNKHLDDGFSIALAAQFVIDEFAKALVSGATMTADIEAHLLLTEEFKNHMRSQPQGQPISVRPVQPASIAPANLFGPKRVGTPIDKIVIASRPSKNKESELSIFRKTL